MHQGSWPGLDLSSSGAEAQGQQQAPRQQLQLHSASAPAPGASWTSPTPLLPPVLPDMGAAGLASRGLPRGGHPPEPAVEATAAGALPPQELPLGEASLQLAAALVQEIAGMASQQWQDTSAGGAQASQQAALQGSFLEPLLLAGILQQLGAHASGASFSAASAFHLAPEVSDARAGSGSAGTQGYQDSTLMAPSMTNSDQYGLGRRDDVSSRPQGLRGSSTSRPSVKVTVSLPADGYVWLKYGEKQLVCPTRTRAYFKCARSKGDQCQAKKFVDLITEQDGFGTHTVGYVNDHNHESGAQEADDEHCCALSIPAPPQGLGGAHQAAMAAEGGVFAPGSAAVPMSPVNPLSKSDGLPQMLNALGMGRSAAALHQAEGQTAGKWLHSSATSSSRHLSSLSGTPAPLGEEFGRGARGSDGVLWALESPGTGQQQGATLRRSKSPAPRRAGMDLEELRQETLTTEHILRELQSLQELRDHPPRTRKLDFLEGFLGSGELFSGRSPKAARGEDAGSAELLWAPSAVAPYSVLTGAQVLLSSGFAAATSSASQSTLMESQSLPLSCSTHDSMPARFASAPWLINAEVAPTARARQALGAPACPPPSQGLQDYTLEIIEETDMALRKGSFSSHEHLGSAKPPRFGPRVNPTKGVHLNPKVSSGELNVFDRELFLAAEFGAGAGSFRLEQLPPPQPEASGGSAKLFRGSSEPSGSSQSLNVKNEPFHQECRGSVEQAAPLAAAERWGYTPHKVEMAEAQRRQQGANLVESGFPRSMSTPEGACSPTNRSHGALEVDQMLDPLCLLGGRDTLRTKDVLDHI